jgi:N-acetylmuramoyl-L-alanine amidase
MKIVIDPGHGQYGNPYPPRPGYYEGTQMWKLSTYLKPELEKRGFQVVTTRPKVTDDPALSARGKMAAGHDLIISLHSNAPASASDTKPTGSVIYRTIETPEIKPLCDKIGQRISGVMGHHYRGTMIKESGSRPGKNYNGVLRNAMASGCKAGMLIEHGFHTNLNDSAFLIKDENLKKLAVAEAEIIAEYYGSASKEKEGDILLNRTLRHGMSGEDVELVQRFLKNLGYYSGPIDGSFGPGQGFLNAVKAFQQAEGLQVDGVVGPATRARIIEMMLEPKKEVEKIVEVESPALKKKVESLEAELKRYEDFFKQFGSFINRP